VQANCPNCSQRIVIDDAKVPDRAFSVKCPKCQTVVKFPGKGAAPPTIAVAAAPATGTFAVPPAAGAASAVTPTAGPSEAPEPGPSEEMRASMMAQLRRELAIGEGRPAGRAMVALPDRARAGAMALPLTRLGYQVDTVDNPEEGARLLEQGVYDLVVTTRAAAAGGRESLYQRINRLSADGRRRIFLVLVGDEFKTGDGTQAWSVMADLVIAARDVPNADATLLPTLAERTRLYQVFLDARKRQEASAV
jgi:predicted Zn finger-like uncharacterized protein